MDTTHHFLAAMLEGLGAPPEALRHADFVGEGPLASVFPVADFAAASVAAAGLALGELVHAATGTQPAVVVDRRLASLWFGWSLQPIGWHLPSPWDPVAGDYAGRDGWIRLHTNAPHHRVAALQVLRVPAERDAVARAVSSWSVEELEAAVVQAGGCAAAMRTAAQWRAHPQGQAVAAEPLVQWQKAAAAATGAWRGTSSRPLCGLRVLDLTRVLAGPVATRFLAGCGAEVLRIDPPGWDEPAVVPDVSLGKRCARLDLTDAADRQRFETLLRQADVLVHGYRADALASLGFGTARRRELNPALVDVALDAYGWSGAWRDRRGFDSLVQMSLGIAQEGMQRTGADRPTPLPVQALDHATGYLMAAAVLHGLAQRLLHGAASGARLSLARTGALLVDGPRQAAGGDNVKAGEADHGDELEHTAFGAARRLRGPVSVGGVALRWTLPAGRLGASAAEWGAA